MAKAAISARLDITQCPLEGEEEIRRGEWGGGEEEERAEEGRVNRKNGIVD